MRTVDQAPAASMTRWSRLARDVSLLLRMARLVIGYVVVGGRVRRAYARHERNGSMLFVDLDADS